MFASVAWVTLVYGNKTDHQGGSDDHFVAGSNCRHPIYKVCWSWLMLSFRMEQPGKAGWGVTDMI